ncbi:MAG TPA: hypothetical protein VEA40_12735 [Ramlibacter sp.]|nr:hypothetical protein [Ramlibacter sp.]
MTITTPEMMPGSAGRPDYFVVARQGGIWLGLKAVVGALPDGAPAVGCRIRSAWAPSPPVGTSLPVVMPKSAAMLSEAWPEIAFEQVDESRASATWVLRLRATSPAGVRQEILARNLGVKIAQHLAGAIRPECEVVFATEALATLLTEAWFALLDAITPEGADIVPLPKMPGSEDEAPPR